MKDIFLLDMDDTLLDFQKAEEANFFATLGAFGMHAERNVYERFHKINDDLWRLLERGGITREALKVRRFAELCGEFGYAADASAMSQWYFDNFPGICFPFEGAVEFLKILSVRGRVYIVTNGSAGIQKQHIADAGFSPYLADVFISEELGFNKPSKEYADYVKSHIPDFSERRAIWLGDSLTSDMVCAKNAGIDFILFAPAGKPAGYEGLWTGNYEEVLNMMDRSL